MKSNEPFLSMELSQHSALLPGISLASALPQNVGAISDIPCRTAVIISADGTGNNSNALSLCRENGVETLYLRVNSPAGFAAAERILAGVSGEFRVIAEIPAVSRINELHSVRSLTENGVEALITRPLFSCEEYHDFVERAALAGITAPISAGVMVLTQESQAEQLINAGTALPEKLLRFIVKYRASPEALRDAGIAFANEQIVTLLSGGVDRIHFYGVNSDYIAGKISALVSGILV